MLAEGFVTVDLLILLSSWLWLWLWLQRLVDSTDETDCLETIKKRLIKGDH